MRLLIVTSLFLSHLHLFAQYNDLLQNPDYTWVAEYTTDFELNPVYNTNLTDEYNLLNVIRIDNQSAVNGIYEESEITILASRFVLDGLNKGAFSCFADSLFQQPVSPQRLRAILDRPDTTMNSNHPWDTIVSINEVHAEEIELFRVRMVLYYHAPDRILGARLLALAPLIAVKDEEGNSIGHRPLVWIKPAIPEGKAGKKLLKSATYTVQTRMKENAPTTDQTRSVKGKLDFQKWAAGEVSNPSHRSLSNDAFKPLNATELKALVFTTDTIVSYNDNYEQKIEGIVQNDATRQVEKIRFVQNWYFDERKHAFDCRIVAVAPLAAIRDSEGNFRYYKPLFYVKY